MSRFLLCLGLLTVVSASFASEFDAPQGPVGFEVKSLNVKEGTITTYSVPSDVKPPTAAELKKLSKDQQEAAMKKFFASVAVEKNKKVTEKADKMKPSGTEFDQTQSTEATFWGWRGYRGGWYGGCYGGYVGVRRVWYGPSYSWGCGGYYAPRVAVVGPYGGVAVAGPNGAVAVGPYGGVAAVGYANPYPYYYNPYYATYTTTYCTGVDYTLYGGYVYP